MWYDRYYTALRREKQSKKGDWEFDEGAIEHVDRDGSTQGHWRKDSILFPHFLPLTPSNGSWLPLAASVWASSFFSLDRTLLFIPFATAVAPSLLALARTMSNGLLLGLTCYHHAPSYPLFCQERYLPLINSSTLALENPPHTSLIDLWEHPTPAPCSHHT